MLWGELWWEHCGLQRSVSGTASRWGAGVRARHGGARLIRSGNGRDTGERASQQETSIVHEQVTASLRRKKDIVRPGHSARMAM